MFMFRAKKYLAELEKYRPDILEACKLAILNAKDGDDFINVDKELLFACPDESVDYAVMEKTSDAVVVSLDADWSVSVHGQRFGKSSDKDHQGNVITGDTYLHNANNCYINTDEKVSCRDWC